jgi:methylated-DNA-[protein]-cysteine S-methyltransferase
MGRVRNDVSLGRTDNGMKLRKWRTDTPVGTLSLVARGREVVAAGFTDDIDDLLVDVTDGDAVEAASSIPGVTDRIEAYFNGDIKAIDDIQIAPEGSDRKKSAWNAMRKTPPGPMSYAGLARLMPPPASPRSAARACATNPVTLIVPCHRFIGSDGKMHGYYWGLDTKEWLLEHERRFS